MNVTVGDRAGSKLAGQPGAPRHTERDALLERDESPGPWTKPHLALGVEGKCARQDVRLFLNSLCNSSNMVQFQKGLKKSTRRGTEVVEWIDL